MNIFFNCKYLKLYHWQRVKVAGVSHIPYDRCKIFQGTDRWGINKIYQNDFDFLLIIVFLFHCTIYNDILHNSGFQSLRYEIYQSSDRWRIHKIYQNDFDFLMIIVLLFHCMDEI